MLQPGEQQHNKMLKNYKVVMCNKCAGNCWNCFYADECNIWNDVEPCVPVFETRREIWVALCESRHDIPAAVNGSIYPQTIEDPMNFDALRDQCCDALNPAFNVGVKKVNIFVTGMTSALLTAINYCRECGVECVTWHYDKEVDGYQPLPIV